MVIVFLFLGSIIILSLAINSSSKLLGIPKNAKVIDLSNKGLDSLPAEIGEFTSATSLILDNNNLTGALPAEIGKLTKLEVLTASNNKLTGIPAEIGKLKNLKLIDFSHNQIDTFPNELIDLNYTITINLSDNLFSNETKETLKNSMPNASLIF